MPGDHLLGDAHLQLAGGEIVEEHQRFGAAHHEVVDAHRDEIDADRVVLVGHEGQLQLGADAVGAGHQHRLLVAGGNGTQARETTQPAFDFGTVGAAHVGLDPFHQLVTRVDVDAGVSVTEPCACLRVGWVLLLCHRKSFL